jgi:shikimate dehydrogenase
MHNAALAALNLPYIYVPFSVAPDHLGPAVRSLIALGIVGVNLTIPHKERVLPFLDEITPEAQAVGAVNTVHNAQGRLVGFNTDGAGFAEPLRARGFGLRGKRAVVLGAGGAARSVVFRLAQEGAHMTLLNRTPERAVRLAEEVNRAVGRTAVTPLGWSADASLRERLAESELLVNTTPVGMSPQEEEMPPIPVESLHPRLMVYDLIYRPRETRLLAAARMAGAQTLNGVPMLVHQGAAALSIWTGVQPPVAAMERAVLEGLGYDAA